jgi:hypothetical protein
VIVRQCDNLARLESIQKKAEVGESWIMYLYHYRATNKIVFTIHNNDNE